MLVQCRPARLVAAEDTAHVPPPSAGCRCPLPISKASGGAAARALSIPCGPAGRPRGSVGSCTPRSVVGATALRHVRCFTLCSRSSTSSGEGTHGCAACAAGAFLLGCCSGSCLLCFSSAGCAGTECWAQPAGVLTAAGRRSAAPRVSKSSGLWV